MDTDFVKQMSEASRLLLEDLQDGKEVDPKRVAMVLSFWHGLGVGATERADAAEAEVKRLEAVVGAWTARRTTLV